MRRDVQSVTVVVRDYDEAIEYFSSVLDFVVVEDRRNRFASSAKQVAPVASIRPT